MNRDELAGFFKSIREDAEIAETVLRDRRAQGPTVETEALFRAAKISFLLGRIQQRLVDTPQPSGRPDLHVLANRDGGDAA